MRKIIYIFFLMVLTLESTEYKGSLSVPDNNFDVLGYDVILNLYKYDSLRVDGICKTNILMKDSNDLVYIFHLENLVVDKIIYGEFELEFEKVQEENKDLSHYNVNIGKYSDTVEIEIYYSGTMNSENQTASSWGGVHYSQEVLYSLGVGFSNSYISTTRHWLPCFDHPFDKAKFEIEFRINNDNLFAASNGLLVENTETKDFRIIKWKQDKPCATYLLTFAVSDYQKVSFESDIFVDLPIEVYSKAKDTNNVKKYFNQLPKILEVFSDLFVDYPFEKVGYVITPKGAMEHQTMVSFPSSLLNSGGVSVVAHELAHQWFGDYVTPTDFRHAWLSESFATYCEAIWFGAFWDSNKDYLNELHNKRSNYINTVSKSDGILPLYDFPRDSPSSNYPQTIYQKGAVVLGMLRAELGDTIFFKSLRDYLERYKYSNATTENLLEIINENSEEKLNWFFNQWVYGKGWPKYEVETFLKDGKTVLKFMQVQDSDWGIFRNVNIEISYRVGGEKKSKLISIENDEYEVVIDDIIDDNKINFNERNKVISLFEIVSFTSAIEEYFRNKLIDIYPNPVDSNIIIENNFNQNLELFVFDLLGNIVFTTKIIEGKNNINLSELESGVYNIVIEAGNFFRIEKIIKH